MPRLPSAGDVKSISPRVSSDPGLDVPAGAFESAPVDEFSPVFERLAQAAQVQQNRRAAVDAADKINKYNLQADELLRTYNTEQDLSDNTVAGSYGSDLAKLKQELIESHQGTDESKARLQIRLGQIESQSIGRAAAISTTLGMEKSKKALGDSLDPLFKSAEQDPSIQNIDELFLSADGLVRDLSGAFNPTEEDVLRDAAREQIALSAIDSLMTSGRIEEADGLLNEGGLSAALSPNTQREVSARIRGARQEKDKLINEANAFREAFRATTGRDPTEAEILDGAFGIQKSAGAELTTSNTVEVLNDQGERIRVPVSQAVREGLPMAPDEPKESENDKQTKMLVDMGLDPATAYLVANSLVKIVGPDEFGSFFRVFPDGTKEKLEDKTSKIISETAGESTGQEEAPGSQKRSIFEAAEQGTGPGSKLRDVTGNIFGFLTEGEMFPDTTESRTQIQTFVQRVKVGFLNNPKAPVAEQEIVKKFLPDVDAFFRDPDKAVTQLKQIKRDLDQAKVAKQKELDKGNISSKRRAQLTDEISSIDEVLSLMESDGGIEVVTSQEEYDKLPEGAEYKVEGSEEIFVKSGK